MTISASGRASCGTAHLQPSAVAILRRVVWMSISSTSASGSRAAGAAFRQRAGADDGNPVSGTRCSIPETVYRGFHVGGKRRTTVRDIVGNVDNSSFRNDKSVLIGMEAEYPTADSLRRAVFNDADGGIALIDSSGELAGLEGPAHLCHSVCRTSPRKTRLSLPLLIALTEVRTSSSPGRNDRNGFATISLRSGATTRKRPCLTDLNHRLTARRSSDTEYDRRLFIQRRYLPTARYIEPIAISIRIPSPPLSSLALMREARPSLRARLGSPSQRCCRLFSAVR